MSLIVARKGIIENSDVIFIVSDTRLTDPKNKVSLHWKKGVIKTNIINKKITISWVGGSRNADNALKQFSAMSCQNLSKDEIINFFYKSHQDSFNSPGQSVDFIISCTDPDLEIIEIKEKRVIRNQVNSWIGSRPAFELFQKRISDYQLEYPYLSLYMIKSMENVVESQECLEVGDFAIGVFCTKEKGCFFQPRFSSMNNSQKFHYGVNFIEIGDSASGSYAVSLNPCLNKDNAIAFYFNQGEFCLLYLSDDGGVMRVKNEDVIKATTPDEFSKIVLDKYGLDIQPCFK